MPFLGIHPCIIFVAVRQIPRALGLAGLKIKDSRFSFCSLKIWSVGFRVYSFFLASSRAMCYYCFVIYASCTLTTGSLEFLLELVRHNVSCVMFRRRATCPRVLAKINGLQPALLLREEIVCLLINFNVTVISQAFCMMFSA